jgi:cysteine desulfurase/selenocysteine lyase
LPLKFEAGTANYVGAIGLGEAIRYLSELDMAAIEQHEHELTRYAEQLLGGIDGLRIYGNTPNKCSIISFNVEGVHHYDMGMILDKLGIAVRTGQHCAEPVMKHYGVTGMCRASLAMYNTREEMEALCRGVERAVRMLR